MINPPCSGARIIILVHCGLPDDFFPSRPRADASGGERLWLRQRILIILVHCGLPDDFFSSRPRADALGGERLWLRQSPCLIKAPGNFYLGFAALAGVPVEVAGGVLAELTRALLV